MNLVEKLIKTFDKWTNTKPYPSGKIYDDYNTMFGSVLTAYLQDYKGMYTGTYKKGTKLTDKDFKKMEEHCELLRHKGMTVTTEFHTDYAVLTVLM